MADIGAVIRREVGRLAAQSARAAREPLEKEIARLKSRLAKQERLLAQLAKDNARLVADLKDRLARPPAASPEELKHSHLGPHLIRRLRGRLGLTRERFAKLLGVSASAVSSWESGTARPRHKARAALIALRKIGKREARWRLEPVRNGVAPRRAEAAEEGTKTAAASPELVEVQFRDGALK